MRHFLFVHTMALAAAFSVALTAIAPPAVAQHVSLGQPECPSPQPERYECAPDGSIFVKDPPVIGQERIESTQDESSPPAPEEPPASLVQSVRRQPLGAAAAGLILLVAGAAAIWGWRRRRAMPSRHT